MKTFIIDGVPYTVQDEVHQLIGRLENRIERKDLEISQNENEIKDYRSFYRGFAQEGEVNAKTINYRLDQIKSLIQHLNTDFEYCIENNFFKDEDENEKTK